MGRPLRSVARAPRLEVLDHRRVRDQLPSVPQVKLEAGRLEGEADVGARHQVEQQLVGAARADRRHRAGEARLRGAVVVAARTLLNLNYSREVERAADRYSVILMSQANADPHALAAILSRIAVNTRPQVRLLRNHPDTGERVAAIKAIRVPPARQPLIDDAEWAALKRICAGG